jgi:CubicO group peptidase (beta-lactamase class C family)
LRRFARLCMSHAVLACLVFTPHASASAPTSQLPSAFSQAPTLSDASAPTQPSTPSLTLRIPVQSDLAAFFDGLVPHALSRAGIPGAAVAIVKDGQILFARGYGYADLAERRPVQADATLFRQGSVSKLFTWTAVMQLIEQGKLELDADVNRYLDFKIPATRGRAITLQHLLTHTAGFEDMAASVAYPSANQLVPLGQHLRTHIPERIFAPGERIAYSNYGNALAGYIVERVSGEPFADYVRKHILEPLGMSRSTFEQPLPQALVPMMAHGYESISKSEPEPFAYVQIAPAGALSATVTDMAHFAIAHLQGGRFGDGRILREETVDLMHARHYEVAPGTPGFAFGFWEARRNGWRMLGHSGDVGSFHTNLYLVPEAGYGIVTQLNGTGEYGRKRGSDIVRSEIIEAFMDRYLPGEIAAQPTIATQRADAERVVGYYRSTRRNESMTKFMAVVQDDDEITALPDGTIEISTRLQASGVPKRWREVAPLSYRDINGESLLSFVTDRQGRVRYWVSDDYPPAMVFERLDGLRGMGLLKPLFLLSCVTVVVTAVSGLVSLVRRRAKVNATSDGKALKGWALARSAYGVQVLVLLAWAMFVVTDLGGYANGGSIGPLYGMRGVSLLGVAASLPALGYAIVSVRSGIRASRQVGECAAALASIYIGWFLASYTL